MNFFRKLSSEAISKQELIRGEEYFIATQWQLMWRKFRRHKLALTGGFVLIIFYVFCFLAEFIAPSTPWVRNRELVYAPPQRVRIFHEGKIHRPFVYGYEKSIDILTTQRIYTPDHDKIRSVLDTTIIGHVTKSKNSVELNTKSNQTTDLSSEGWNAFRKHI